MDHDVDLAAIERYLAGTASAAEVAGLEAWVAADPARRQVVAALGAVWRDTPDRGADLDVDAFAKRVGARTTARPPREAGRELRIAAQLTAPARPTRLWSALMAAGIGAVAVGGWWLSAHRSPVAPAVGPAPGPGREYSTARGQQLRLTLPDGSGVLLGPESVLQVASAYGSSSRVVELVGDAYFTVAHDADRPFEVRTAYVTARDLGTRFVVRARRSDDRIRVVVVDGRVAVARTTTPRSDAALWARRSLASDSLVLNRADLAEIGVSGPLRSERGVNLDPLLAWTEGRLVFSEERLSTVLAEVERWYGVEIRLTDSALAGRRITGTFHDEPVSSVLENIRSTLGARLVRDGRRYTLGPAGAP